MWTTDSAIALVLKHIDMCIIQVTPWNHLISEKEISSLLFYAQYFIAELYDVFRRNEPHTLTIKAIY